MSLPSWYYAGSPNRVNELGSHRGSRKTAKTIKGDLMHPELSRPTPTVEPEPEVPFNPTIPELPPGHDYTPQEPVNIVAPDLPPVNIPPASQPPPVNTPPASQPPVERAPYNQPPLEFRRNPTNPVLTGPVPELGISHGVSRLARALRNWGGVGDDENLTGSQAGQILGRLPYSSALRGYSDRYYDALADAGYGGNSAPNYNV